MDVTDPKQLSVLRQAAQIRRDCELSARLTGENFNVFDILGLATAEVRTHSAFLAELLNAQGSHGQKATYLELFIKSFVPKLASCDLRRWTAEVEHWIGLVDNDRCEGGQIDIVLWDEKGRARILIENKIMARDQTNQLLRYHEYAKTAVLIYLTLDGRKPDEKATGGKVDPMLLSYKTDILKWLEDCHRASVSLPVIRESIFQYKNLICKLTGQTTGDKVKEEAKKLILGKDCDEAANYIEGVEVLWQAWGDVLSETKTKFETKMKEALTSPNAYTVSGAYLQEDYRLPSGITITRVFGMNDFGVYIGFRTDAQDDNGRQKVRAYAAVLKSLDHTALADDEWWDVGWFNPIPFRPKRNFEQLPKSKVLSLCRDDEMAKFVADLKHEIEGITTKLLEASNSY